MKGGTDFTETGDIVLSKGSLDAGGGATFRKGLTVFGKLNVSTGNLVVPDGGVEVDKGLLVRGAARVHGDVLLNDYTIVGDGDFEVQSKAGAPLLRAFSGVDTVHLGTRSTRIVIGRGYNDTDIVLDGRVLLDGPALETQEADELSIGGAYSLTTDVHGRFAVEATGANGSTPLLSLGADAGASVHGPLTVRGATRLSEVLHVGDRGLRVKGFSIRPAPSAPDLLIAPADGAPPALTVSGAGAVSIPRLRTGAEVWVGDGARLVVAGGSNASALALELAAEGRRVIAAADFGRDLRLGPDATRVTVGAAGGATAVPGALEASGGLRAPTAAVDSVAARALTVRGPTRLRSVEARGNASVNGSVAVAGDTRCGGALTVQGPIAGAGAAAFGGALAVHGPATLGAGARVEGPLHFRGGFALSGPNASANASAAPTLTFGGPGSAAAFGGRVTVGQALAVRGPVDVHGNATVRGPFVGEGDAQFRGALEGHGPARLRSSVRLQGPLRFEVCPRGTDRGRCVWPLRVCACGSVGVWGRCGPRQRLFALQGLKPPPRVALCRASASCGTGHGLDTGQT